MKNTIRARLGGMLGGKTAIGEGAVIVEHTVRIIG
jgi:hypothetical protein